MWFVESRNTLEEDLAVIVVEHDITSHKEGDTINVSLVFIFTCVLCVRGKFQDLTVILNFL